MKHFHLSFDNHFFTATDNDIRHVVLFMENGGFCRVSLSIDKGCL